MMRPKVFLEWPRSIRFYGPLTIEYHNYGGPAFWLSVFGREIRLWPHRYSPLWLVWALVRKDMEAKP